MNLYMDRIVRALEDIAASLKRMENNPAPNWYIPPPEPAKPPVDPGVPCIPWAPRWPVVSYGPQTPIAVDYGCQVVDPSQWRDGQMTTSTSVADLLAKRENEKEPQ